MKYSDECCGAEFAVNESERTDRGFCPASCKTDASAVWMPRKRSSRKGDILKPYAEKQEKQRLPLSEQCRQSSAFASIVIMYRIRLRNSRQRSSDNLFIGGCHERSDAAHKLLKMQFGLRSCNQAETPDHF